MANFIIKKAPKYLYQIFRVIGFDNSYYYEKVLFLQFTQNDSSRNKYTLIAYINKDSIMDAEYLKKGGNGYAGDVLVEAVFKTNIKEYMLQEYKVDYRNVQKK